MSQKNKIRSDVFSDGILIFLNYIDRKIKENHEYKPHPMIRALEVALVGIEEHRKKNKKNNTPQHFMGFSADGDEKRAENPYTVILEDNGDKISIKEIIDMQTKENVPVEVMIRIFRTQMKLDRIKGDTVDLDQAIAIFRDIIPELHIYALGDNWRKAVETFKKNIEEGKMAIPNDPHFREKVIPELLKIKQNTPWEEYPHIVRSFIGGSSGEIIDKRGNVVVITTPKSIPIEKYKVFEMITESLLGFSAKYFGFKDCRFCKLKNIKNHILFVTDYFYVAVDANPIVEGHMLVISNQHSRSLADLRPEQVKELKAIIKLVEDFYIKTYDKPLSAYEPCSEMKTVFHAHLHLLPGQFSIADQIESHNHKIEYISELKEVIDFAIKEGIPFLGYENNQFFIGQHELSEEELFDRSRITVRSLLTAQTQSPLVDWEKSMDSKELKKISSKLVEKTKSDWNKYEK